jgi:hypothetical protein
VETGQDPGNEWDFGAKDTQPADKIRFILGVGVFWGSNEAVSQSTPRSVADAMAELDYEAEKPVCALAGVRTLMPHREHKSSQHIWKGFGSFVAVQHLHVPGC